MMITMQGWDELRSVKESAKRLRRAEKQARDKYGDDVARWPYPLQWIPDALADDVALYRALEGVARG